MSKITNDGLTRSGAGCFIAVYMETVSVKGLRMKTGSNKPCPNNRQLRRNQVEPVYNTTQIMVYSHRQGHESNNSL